MRWQRRVLLVTGALAVLLAVPGAAAADEMYLGLRSVDCSGVTVSGSGLPASTNVTVTVLDSVHRRQLDRRAVTTSAGGTFVWRSRVSLSGLRSVRAVVARAGESRPIAWAEHQVPTACPLAYTGPGPVVPMLGLSLSSLILGFLLLTAVSYMGHHFGLHQGRHVAAR